MNLPNRLTILRVALVPVCLVLLGAGEYLLSALVFTFASLTDMLDGRIARKRNLITNFGKFADPIADKVLTLSMMIYMACLGLLPVWLPIVVAIRELLVDGLRLVAMEQGKVLPAGASGKVKTVTQMVCILVALAFAHMSDAPYYVHLNIVLSVIVCALTVYSGAEYFYHARAIFSKDFTKDA